MEIESLEIKDVKIINPRVFPDERGFFQQCYHSSQYRDAGIDAEFVQDNWSHSRMGVVRGLHYQLQFCQDKIVFVVRGEIFDVVVDVRRGSPTYGKWVSARLSGENHRQIFVPKGFAHGFCVLSAEVDLIYKCSEFYKPEDGYGIYWNDPAIGIEWPSHSCTPTLSPKDARLPLLGDMDADLLPEYEQKNVCCC